MQISTVEIDIGKNIFHLVGMDKKGNILLRKKLLRQKVTEFIARL